jgi:hypothetical protein
MIGPGGGGPPGLDGPGLYGHPSPACPFSLSFVHQILGAPFRDRKHVQSEGRTPVGPNGFEKVRTLNFGGHTCRSAKFGEPTVSIFGSEIPALAL